MEPKGPLPCLQKPVSWYGKHPHNLSLNSIWILSSRHCLSLWGGIFPQAELKFCMYLNSSTRADCPDKISDIKCQYFETNIWFLHIFYFSSCPSHDIVIHSYLSALPPPVIELQSTEWFYAKGILCQASVPFCSQRFEWQQKATFQRKAAILKKKLFSCHDQEGAPRNLTKANWYKSLLRDYEANFTSVWMWIPNTFQRGTSGQSAVRIFKLRLPYKMRKTTWYRDSPRIFLESNPGYPFR